MPALRALHRKIIVSTVLVVVLIVTGLGVSSLLYAMREEPARRDSQLPVPMVESQVIQRESVRERFTGYGTVEPLRVTHLAAEVSSVVVELVDGVRPGVAVEANQVLVKLDDRTYQQQRRQAQALVDADTAGIDELDIQQEKLAELIDTATQEEQVTRREWLRVADLYERKLAAKKEYDFANLAFHQSRRVLQALQMDAARLGPRRRGLAASREAHRAEERQAGLKVERCHIAAPYAGVVRNLAVEQGDWVGPGSVVLTMIDPTQVEIGIQLAAAVHDRVTIGAACRVESESQPGVTWQGTVARIAPDVDQQTRTFAAYVEVDNTARARSCVPGTFVRAIVDGPLFENAILVPRDAIRDGHVWIALDGSAALRNITVERLIADRAVITGDIAVGDRVILTHQDQLNVGDAIRWYEATTSKTPSSGGSSVERRIPTP